MQAKGRDGEELVSRRSDRSFEASQGADEGGGMAGTEARATESGHGDRPAGPRTALNLDRDDKASLRCRILFLAVMLSGTPVKSRSSIFEKLGQMRSPGAGEPSGFGGRCLRFSPYPNGECGGFVLHGYN